MCTRSRGASRRGGLRRLVALVLLCGTGAAAQAPNERYFILVVEERARWLHARQSVDWTPMVPSRQALTVGIDAEGRLMNDPPPLAREQSLALPAAPRRGVRWHQPVDQVDSTDLGFTRRSGRRTARIVGDTLVDGHRHWIVIDTLWLRLEERRRSRVSDGVYTSDVRGTVIGRSIIAPGLSLVRARTDTTVLVGVEARERPGRAAVSSPLRFDGTRRFTSRPYEATARTARTDADDRESRATRVRETILRIRLERGDSTLLDSLRRIVREAPVPADRARAWRSLASLITTDDPELYELREAAGDSSLAENPALCCELQPGAPLDEVQARYLLARVSDPQRLLGFGIDEDDWLTFIAQRVASAPTGVSATIDSLRRLTAGVEVPSFERPKRALRPFPSRTADWREWFEWSRSRRLNGNTLDDQAVAPVNQIVLTEAHREALDSATRADGRDIAAELRRLRATDTSDVAQAVLGALLLHVDRAPLVPETVLVHLLSSGREVRALGRRELLSFTWRATESRGGMRTARRVTDGDVMELVQGSLTLLETGRHPWDRLPPTRLRERAELPVMVDHRAYSDHREPPAFFDRTTDTVVVDAASVPESLWTTLPPRIELRSRAEWNTQDLWAAGTIYRITIRSVGGPFVEVHFTRSGRHAVPRDEPPDHWTDEYAFVLTRIAGRWTLLEERPQSFF